MKSLEPQKITGFISLGFLFLATIFFLANYFSPNLYYSLAISIPLFFVLSFAMVSYFVNNFINSRIKPIYKSIHGFKQNDVISEDDSDNKDILSNINKEVADWMKTRNQEILELKQMEKYRKEFLGNVSHELKTPIFNIQGYILTLLDGGLDDQNINMLYLNRTEKSINRMISIVDDLEAISKLEAGELELNISSFNIKAMFDDVFDMQEIRANEKNIKLKYGKGLENSIKVNADKERLFQVVINLIVNSINYGKKGGQTTVNFYDMDKRILVEIKDNGIGIAEEHLPRIFERFFRADKSRSREQGGTGLGLAIVKHIIEAHNQRINVSSKLGKGTSFTFTLEKAS